MRRKLLVALLVTCVPSFAYAQATCPDCVIGIWDEVTLENNFGTMTPQDDSKDIFIGIKLADGHNGYTGMELSVDGLADFIVIEEGRNNPSVDLGDIQAPEDKQNGSGGKNVAWAECQTDPAFYKLTLISLGPPPDDAVFQVLMKFPPTNPTFDSSLFTQCDDPQFTPTLTSGGCYTLNPTGADVGCPTAVQEHTWGGLKEMYR